MNKEEIEDMKKDVALGQVILFLPVLTQRYIFKDWHEGDFVDYLKAKGAEVVITRDAAKVAKLLLNTDFPPTVIIAGDAHSQLIIDYRNEEVQEYAPGKESRSARMSTVCPASEQLRRALALEFLLNGDHFGVKIILDQGGLPFRHISLYHEYDERLDEETPLNDYRMGSWTGGISTPLSNAVQWWFNCQKHPNHPLRRKSV